MREKDLTKGSIPGHLACLTAPLIAGNMLQQLYNAVDAWVNGRYAGEKEFAAVGVASSVMNLFLFAIVGACIGISVILAQFYGAGDRGMFRREHALALVTGTAASVLAAGAGIFCLPVLLALLRTPDEVAGSAQTYLHIVLAALPASFFYNFYSALFRAVGKARVSLGILALAAGINLILDLFFVIRLRMGIAGVAWATFVSQAASAAASFLYMYLGMPGLKFSRTDCRFDKGLLKKTLHFAGVTGMQQTGLYIGKLLVQGAVNTGGTEMISAYTATTRIEGFANSFGDSGCSATAVLVAQNCGAEKGERVKKTVCSSFIMLGSLGILSAVILYFAAVPLSRFMTGGGSGRIWGTAAEYLHIIALFYVLCFTGNTLAGYFDGCGRVSVSLIGTISQISLRTILSWAWVEQYGLQAVAAATGAGWIFVNFFWLVLYCRTSPLNPKTAGSSALRSQPGLPDATERPE